MKTFEPLFRLLILGVICVVTFASASVVKGADSITNATQLNPTSSIVLPSHMDEFFFYVQARIGDHPPLNLVLDTGASHLVLEPRIAARLRDTGMWHDTASERVSTASGKQPEMNFAKVRSVSLGDLLVRDTTVIVSDVTILSKLMGETIDGIAGMALFESGTLVLDFPKKEVRFVQGEAEVTARTVVLPCEFFDHNTPVVRIELAGQKFEALIDSGSSEGFAIPFKSRNYPFVAPPVTVSLSAAASDIMENKAARLATNVHWGGITFERPIVTILESDTGLIGRKVLEHFIVGLDQRKQRLLLTPATNRPVVSTPTKSLGFSVLLEEGGLRVVAVLPDTDAARAGIRRGDFLSAIDGKPAKKWNQKLLNRLRDRAETVEVDLLRKSKTEKVKLGIKILVE